MVATAVIATGLMSAPTAQAELFEYTLTGIAANLTDGTDLTGSFKYDANPANGEGTFSDFNFTFTDNASNVFTFATPPSTLVFDRNAEWDTTLLNAGNSSLRFNFFNVLSNNQNGGNNGNGGLQSNTSTFAFEFANLTPSGGNFGSNANFSVAAVPEPETFAMFLAGLGLLGFARRAKQA
jgi:hypothetical protein